jgi:hypothetical protein
MCTLEYGLFSPVENYEGRPLLAIKRDPRCRFVRVRYKNEALDIPWK